MLSIISFDRSAAKVKQVDYPVFSQPLVSRPPLKSCEVCVIVAVSNEADALENTLLALAIAIAYYIQMPFFSNKVA